MTNTEWHPISEAPRDRRIMARRVPEDGSRGFAGVLTWWGKTSHIAWFGWCHGDDPEDVEIWFPDEWREPTAEEIRTVNAEDGADG